MSSAQVIRDCQTHFNPSTLFRPLIQHEVGNRSKESNHERRKRGRAKREIRVKMGHGGTLDPLATGVLIVGVGKGTKSMQNFLHGTKTYETVVLFGASTDSYDRVGRILKKRSYEHVTKVKVEEALDSFRGKFKQMPPLYSALKMNGKPLYEYAREGKPIPREIETRDVEVSELELLEFYEPGEHTHRWPTEEAGSTEQNLAEQVWRAEKQQASAQAAGVKLSPEEEEDDIKALAEHEQFKRKAEESFNELVYDGPTKRRRTDNPTPMMSGALGDLPIAARRDNEGRPMGKGSNLVPTTPVPNTPPPWEGKGPPAAKIRLTVSSGFYVRSFCHDLGEKLHSAAMMAELERTRQGIFTLKGTNCLDYAELAKGERVWGPLVEDMLVRWIEAEKGSSHDITNAALQPLPTPREDAHEPTIEPKREEEDAMNVDEPSQLATPACQTEAATDQSFSSDTVMNTQPSETVKLPENERLSSLRETSKTASDEDSEWNGFSDDTPTQTVAQSPAATMVP